MGIVRTASEQDAASVADIYAPYVRETAISFDEQAPTAEEMARRMRRLLATHPFLVFEEDGAVLGYAYASPHRDRAAYRWSVDVTVYIAVEAHRRGIGRALYTPLLETVARQGYHRAFAGITLPNVKSVGLHEAMGFTRVGVYREVGFKFGEWRDVAWYERALGDGGPPTEPIAFAALA